MPVQFVIKGKEDPVTCKEKFIGAFVKDCDQEASVPKAYTVRLPLSVTTDSCPLMLAIRLITSG